MPTVSQDHWVADKAVVVVQHHQSFSKLRITRTDHKSSQHPGGTTSVLGSVGGFVITEVQLVVVEIIHRASKDWIKS